MKEKAKTKTKSEKKKMNPKDIIVPTVSLFLICLIATLLLAVVNNFTAPKIAAINEATAISTRSEVLPAASSFTEKDNYFIGIDSNKKTVGYVFTEDSKSYGGNVSVMVGIDTKGKVTGVEITEINDTPGLGMNAKNDSFKNQFVGMSGTIGVNKSGKTDTEIQALTGATITSKAVTKAVNAALSEFSKIGGGK